MALPANWHLLCPIVTDPVTKQKIRLAPQVPFVMRKECRTVKENGTHVSVVVTILVMDKEKHNRGRVIVALSPYSSMDRNGRYAPVTTVDYPTKSSIQSIDCARNEAIEKCISKLFRQMNMDPQ